MNYLTWGKEYLNEAEKIKSHINKIKSGWSEKSQDEKLSVNRRSAMLYEIYLECKHTGELLMQRGIEHENPPA